MSDKWVKVSKDHYTAHSGRFQIHAERLASGRIREWIVSDNGAPLSGKASKCVQNKASVVSWIHSRMSATLTEQQVVEIEREVNMLLHAHRDCLRNRGVDTTVEAVNPNDGYYGEAFGIMRGLAILGFGKFGAVNVAGTLNHWFESMVEEVLKEENFGGSNECDHCLNKYRKDGAGRGLPWRV